MTQKTIIRTLLLATVAALGLTVAASAQSTGAGPSAPVAETGKGLLGQTYAGVAYGYTDLNNTSVSLQGLSFTYNQPVNKGFDVSLDLGDAWSSKFAGTRTRQQTFGGSAIAFMPDQAWGRPFFSIGAGWFWTKTAGVSDNSFLYDFETGVEFQATRELSLTPFVNYTETTSLHVNNKWSYGVKANYWVNDQWGVVGGLGRDNIANMSYSAGVVFRF